MTSPSPEYGGREHHHAMPRAAEGSGNAQGAPGTTGHAGHGDGGAHDRHEGHSVAMFRDRFWITLLLSIPTLLWSGMVQHMFGFSAPALRFRKPAPTSAAFAPQVCARLVSSTREWPREVDAGAWV